jgi:KUP system potassium uptake protein
MTETLQTVGLAPQGVRKQTAAVALTALGVVYGDIGTSTLYGLKQAVEAAGAPTPDTVMGIVSLILWALLLIVALKRRLCEASRNGSVEPVLYSRLLRRSAAQ